MSLKARKLAVLFALCLMYGAHPRACSDEPSQIHRIQNYPYASEYDFKKVQDICSQIRRQLARVNSKKFVTQRAKLERYLSEIEAFTRVKTVAGEKVSIVNFAKSNDKAVKTLREDVKLKPPSGGAILRVYDSKKLMPKPILDLFGPQAGGVTLSCRYCVVFIEGKSENELADTISHELVHAYINSYLGSGVDSLPKWFHEGSAMYLSGARERYVSMWDFGSRVSYFPPDYREYRIVFEYLNDYAGADRVAKFIHDCVVQRSTVKPLVDIAGASSYSAIRERALKWNDAREDKSARILIVAILCGGLLIWIITKRRQARIRRALALLEEAVALARAGSVGEAWKNVDKAAHLESHATRVRMAAQIAREEIQARSWSASADVHKLF